MKTIKLGTVTLEYTENDEGRFCTSRFPDGSSLTQEFGPNEWTGASLMIARHIVATDEEKPYSYGVHREANGVEPSQFEKREEVKEISEARQRTLKNEL